MDGAQAGRRLRLAFEATYHESRLLGTLAVHSVGTDQLDRRGSCQQVVFAEPNFAHAALADPTLEHVHERGPGGPGKGQILVDQVGGQDAQQRGTR